MTDESGEDVSVDALWRSTMMANAARDPYWQATVRSEVLALPGLQAVIEDKCAACHMSMARWTSAAVGEQGEVLDDGYLDPENALHPLGIDAVSCTLCHQIRDEALGTPQSFSGGFVVDTESPPGEREAFGPHPVAEDLIPVMQGTSGFLPVESPHVDGSEFCATCHTLYTPYVDAAGEVAGEFPEQMAYLEWQASAFGGSISCQGCHMPAAEGAVPLSITGGPPRSPIHKHVFAGGNAYMLQMLGTFGEELAVTASSAGFQEKASQVVDQLQGRTATLDVKEVALDGATLTADLSLSIMAGHKFPTGFPSRRAWIHLTVEDAAGEVLFESGGWSASGAITGNDNDGDAARFEPHYRTIDDPGQVQIYEPILGDTEGAVTTVLLRGAGYLKDNRLLPSGFDKTAVEADIAVHGEALADEDFLGGGDQIRYTVDVGDAQGPFTVTAELLYQSIGYRWAENLRAYDAPEPARFVAYYEQVPNQPVAVATTSAQAGE
jgi:hypothetical protein